MCQAFSCLITKSKKVYWKAGVDSHDTLQNLYVKKDKELVDDKDVPKNTFARIEISPENEDYLNPDKWIYKIDERVKPEWLDKSWEKPCWKAWKKWKKKVYSQINLKEARNPIHPFKIEPPKKITKKHIEKLKLWASVWASARASVWDSVWDSVEASVWASVWTSVGTSVGTSVWDSVKISVRDSVRAPVEASVRDSVWGSIRISVGDSVGAYIGSLFPKIKKWKYVDRRKKPFNKIKGYPFEPAVWLWKRGLVPSFDGEVWRLHGSENAKILWEGKV